MRRVSGITVFLFLAWGTLAALLAPGTAAALDGPGTTGAAYLALSLGPKSIAMGEVKAALTGDPFNWMANPAALGSMNGVGVGAVHAEWILESAYEHLSVHGRVNGMFAVAGSFFFEHRPDIAGADEYGMPTHALENSNYQTVVGVACTPIPALSAGVNVKYFRETLDTYHASGVAVDLGAVYAFPLGIRVGAAAQNIGGDVKFDAVGEPLPTAIRAGMSQSLGILPKTLECAYAVDLVKPRYEDVFVSVGAEVQLFKMLALRAGWCGQESRTGDGFTAGAGVLLLDRVQFDYAWTPYGEIGDFQRVSIYFTL